MPDNVHRSGPDAREISQMLNDQALSLVKVILPGGTVAGGYYNIGSVRGDSGDSLKVKLSNGTWADYACSRGDREGTGDMLKLVMLTVGEHDMGRALKWARGWLGIESMDPAVLDRQRQRARVAQGKAEAKRAEGIERSRIKARNLWQMGAPIIGTPAIRYLEGRGIDFGIIGRISGALRFCATVWHADYRRTIPALMTCGTFLDGSHAATHVTYLDRRSDGTWGKLPDWVDPESGECVKAAKKIFGQAWFGAHFPVHKGGYAGGHGGKLADMTDGEPLAIAEGLEDALSYAMTFPARRVVMAGTLGGIGAMVLPDQCGDVTLIAQRDAPGSKAAASAEKQIAKQQEQAANQGGRRQVRLLWPAAGFKDFNDELRGVLMP